MRGDQLSCQAEIILVLQYAKPCQNAQKKLWVEVKTHGYNKSQIFSKIDQKAPLELKVNPCVFWLKLQANPHGYYLSKFDQGQKYFLLFRFCSHRYIYIYILKSVFTYLNLVNFLFIEKYFFKELFKLKESEHVEVLKNTRCRSYCQNLT